MAIVGATMIFADYANEALGHNPLSSGAKDIADAVKLFWLAATLICIIGGW